MRELNEHHSFMGMQKDLVCSKHPVNFLYDARNIRLTSRGDSTMLAITNEKGTHWQLDVTGTYLGHALLGKYLVVFAKSSGSTCYIYRINLEDITIKTLYSGILNFDVNHPIKTLPFYENENIQKVYWVDGLNQPRLINIVGDIREGIDTQFDFIRELQLNETVSIVKEATGGYFPSGVIQYAFTYINKYAQESNIFYISPLFYISPSDRGAAPDESVSNSFKIYLNNTDPNFEIIRIYSIQRTSLDGTAITKRVGDISYRRREVRNFVYKGSSPTYNWEMGEQVIPTPPVESRVIMGMSTSANVFKRRDYPNLYLKGSNGYITWAEDASMDDEIVVSRYAATFRGTYGYGVEVVGRMVVWSDFNPFSALTFTDTGLIGESIDPTELLYKGNNAVIANSITQKDNTVFFGGLRTSGMVIDSDVKKIVKNYCSVYDSKENIYTPEIQEDTLFSVRRHGHIGVYSGAFKHGEIYRLGIQFQYKNGNWTDPIFLNDLEQSYAPVEDSTNITLPIFKAKLLSAAGSRLRDLGFRKARPLVVFPKLNERKVILQGISCPTVYQDNSYRQSSWFFRHYGPQDDKGSSFGNYIPKDNIRSFKPFLSPYDDIYITEIDAYLEDEFQTDYTIQTLNSPEIEFDDVFYNLKLEKVKAVYTGRALISTCDTAVNIQTSSGTINPNSKGVDMYRRHNYQGYGRCAGDFYQDYMADDYDESDSSKIQSYDREDNPMNWTVFAWNRSGSLNNDTARNSGYGVQSAVLKKKVFSNSRRYKTLFNNNKVSYFMSLTDWAIDTSMQPFTSDQVTVLKIDDKIYSGNVDTVLSSKEGIGKYCRYNGLYYIGIDSTSDQRGQWQWAGNGYTLKDGYIGDYNSGIVRNRNIVRMKYKSSPHFVGKMKFWFYIKGDTKNQLPIIDIVNTSTSDSDRFGGSSEEALRGNQWIPCGEPVIINKDGITELEYSYGDTFFTRWECLKTYAFTQEDENQVVEIGSFRLESRVNADGRYDRNRQQRDNTMMSPANFNLMNRVYSQLDNFFTYRILDEDYYNNSDYPNQVTWSKEKQAATDVDAWTNLTLTNTYDMDGTKGKINHLITFKDQIFCFQDKAVSTILFNSRVQIPTSDGVPIEISNNYKVDGHRTLSDGVGCSDGRLVCQTAASLYFIDSITNHLFSISDGLTDISASHYMTSWFVNNKIDKLMYDNLNHDLYVVNDKESLCYSELLNQFTSFFDYDDINLIESHNGRVFTLRKEELHTMFEGDYNHFFKRLIYPAPNVVIDLGKRTPWYLTFISNGTDTQTTDLDKIFTNIDYRMDLSEISEDEFKHSPNLTFDYMQVTTEYQDTGVVQVKRLKDATKPNSFHHKEANTQKKFRIWRIQIPRALTWKTDRITGERKQVQSNDRIRNPWCKITLGNYGNDNIKALLHDINVQYYI